MNDQYVYLAAYEADDVLGVEKISPVETGRIAMLRELGYVEISYQVYAKHIIRELTTPISPRKVNDENTYRQQFASELLSMIEAHDHNLDFRDDSQQGKDPRKEAQKYFDQNISPYWYPEEEDD